MPGKCHLPGASPKYQKQYEAIKKSELSKGAPVAHAKELAAKITNKDRAMNGDTKESKNK